ncbi:MAG: hypothetical protein U5N86_05470 [Planctomycetota bacterium]|nr:hypothetical protein [Planctomycetota bacterium]
MAKAKETGIDIKDISANLLKKLAAQLGYSSAANKAQLIKELRKANDYRGRLAGIITDLSPKARKFYEEHANEQRIELKKLRKECAFSDKDFDKVIEELEQAALCAQLRRSSKKSTGPVYEFITNSSLLVLAEEEVQGTRTF